jgi:putative ABC transport system substrate-binding protein
MSASIAESAAFVDAFRRGMRELGYVEGKNMILEIRGGEGNPSRLSTLARELIDLRVDVIVAGASYAAHAAKESTNTIPVVVRYGGDPVRAGLIGSFARPGGNITGLASMNRGLTGKRFDVLMEVIPGAKHVAVLSAQPDPASFARSTDYKEMESGAKALDVKLQVVSAPDQKALGKAFLAISRERTSGLIVVPSPTYFQHREYIIEQAAKARLAAIYPQGVFAESGGLISYGADFMDEYRRLSIYVDKILKGARPADLPVEQPTKFELVINLKTAKQIGLIIPPNVLARADRVIR